VVKRDGTVEDFDGNKISRVCEALGLSPSQVDVLIKNVSLRVAKLPGDRVSSNQIRDFVINELKDINDYTAEQYLWYHKMNTAKS